MPVRLVASMLLALAIAGCHRAPGRSAEHKGMHPGPARAAGNPYVPPSLAAHTHEIQLADRIRRRLGGHPHELYLDTASHSKRFAYVPPSHHVEKATVK